MNRNEDEVAHSSIDNYVQDIRIITCNLCTVYCFVHNLRYIILYRKFLITHIR